MTEPEINYDLHILEELEALYQRSISETLNTSEAKDD